MVRQLLEGRSETWRVDGVPDSETVDLLLSAMSDPVAFATQVPSGAVWCVPQAGDGMMSCMAFVSFVVWQ